MYFVTVTSSSETFPSKYVEIIMHAAEYIGENSSKNVKISKVNRNDCVVRYRTIIRQSKQGTYRVVSLCSTAVASMTVVVYSMPVVRLVPRLW